MRQDVPKTLALNGTLELDGKMYRYQVLNPVTLKLSLDDKPDEDRPIASLKGAKFILAGGDSKPLSFDQWNIVLKQDIAWAEVAHKGEDLSMIKIDQRYAGFPGRSSLTRGEVQEQDKAILGKLSKAVDDPNTKIEHLEGALEAFSDEGRGLLVYAWTRYAPIAEKFHVDGWLPPNTAISTVKGPGTEYLPYFPKDVRRAGSRPAFGNVKIADEVVKKVGPQVMAEEAVHDFSGDLVHRSPPATARWQP